jgi:uncharacterized repeat protein (TIGR01451 family)
MRRPARFPHAVRTFFANRFSRRGLAIFATIALVAGLGGVAAAVTVGGGTLGNFEIEGNFAVDTAGHLDWTTATKVLVPDDTFDSGFTTGSKELKPSEWDCATGGATPNKGNILRAYVASQFDATHPFVDLGFVAENIQGQGDVHLNFEFNQSGTAEVPGSFTAGACTIPRAQDDILVSFDYPGGNTNPTVNLYKWMPAAVPDLNKDGSWVDQNLSASAAKAAVNPVVPAGGDPLTDPIAGGTVNAGRFGEATIDLSVLFPQGEDAPCLTFGYVNVRSRSSGDSVSSALQDKLPTTKVELSTCGSIVLHKVDNHVPAHALAGAEFGLFKNSGATGAPEDTCFSLADGTCTFSSVKPGNYWVKELSTITGYNFDATIVPVTVGIGQNVDVPTAFVNRRDTGTIRIIKQLRQGDTIVPSNPLSALNGAAFLVYKDVDHDNTYDAGEQALLWPDDAPAQCTITNSLGYCDVGPLPTGTYRIHETAAPPSSSIGPDVGPVEVTTNTTVEKNYVNTLTALDITIDKSAPETQVHVGDTIHYTFAVSTTGPRLHAISVEDVTAGRCDGAITGPVKAPGNQDAFLEPGEIWTYACTHVAAATPDPLLNEAMATGTDDFGRTVSDNDTYSVNILKPAITLDKTVDNGDHKPVANALVVHSGDLVNYKVVITNTGDATLSITSLTDSLKGALSSACTPLPSAPLAPAAHITCEYTANPTNDAHNVASVTAVDGLGGEDGTVTASDETFVDVIHPLIAIDKKVEGADHKPVADALVIHAGDLVHYVVTVTNTGDTQLSISALTDSIAGALSAQCTPLPSSPLAPAAHITCSYTANPTDDTHNVASVTGVDTLGGAGGTVTATDETFVNVINPAITIEKTATSDAQPGDTDVTQAHPGEAIVYHFRVYNSGDVPLTNVSVDDVPLGHIGTIASLAVGATDTSLTKAVTTATTDPAPDLFNTVTACGLDPLQVGLDPVQVGTCGSDTHLIDVINPNIDVVKSVAGGVTSAHIGDEVTYNFAVHNTGDVTLTAVNVNDDVFGHIGDITTLAPNQTVTLTKTVTLDATMVVAAGNAVHNTVTACGADPLLVPKCDTDTHELPVLHPALTIDKKVGGDDHKPVADALLAHQGDTLTYTVVIHNTGDTPLTISALSDTMKTGLSDTCEKGIGEVLAPDESTTCTYTTPAGATDVHNVASVTGVDGAGGPRGTVSANDETFVNVIRPAITVTKTVDPKTVDPGSPATYTYVVTNTGDTALSNVTVTDDVLGDIGTVASLAPGESKTLTTTVVIRADTPRTNVATACGVDALALKVCATAKATITIVLPVPPQHRAPTPRVTVTPPQSLPHTGFRLFLWVAIAIDLMAAGLALMEIQRRSRRA